MSLELVLTSDSSKRILLQEILTLCAVAREGIKKLIPITAIISAFFNLVTPLKNALKDYKSLEKATISASLLVEELIRFVKNIAMSDLFSMLASSVKGSTSQDDTTVGLMF
jgi:hypothetical protein